MPLERYWLLLNTQTSQLSKILILILMMMMMSVKGARRVRVPLDF